LLLTSTLTAILFLAAAPLTALPVESLAVRPALGPPGAVTVQDMPNDAGGRVIISWQLSPGDARITGYRVERQIKDSTQFRKVTFVGKGVTTVTDDRANAGTVYRYRVLAIAGPDTAASELSEYIQGKPEWFHTGRINVLIAGILFIGLVFFFTARARRGAKLFVRRISGLDAVDEALGRATEMGRPILFLPGMHGMDDIATIAACNIMGEVAKRTAQYGTPLIVPNRDPIVYTVAREIVKEAYTQAGRPDAFNPDSVYFVTDNQFAYAAAVDGIMVRERPATNFLMGYYYAESLILAETGASTGAIQIAGTDSVTQLPFFITACDYTLIGEELYAASAYLSREPLLLGGIKGQDYGKAIIVAVLLLATIAALAANLPVKRLFSM
jgi:hypothetical protein